MTTETPGPSPVPVARRVPSERTHHGDTVVDEYAWLAAKDDPATIAYLTAENAYTTARTAHLEQLRATLFEETRRRTQETDLSVPTRKDGYWYYTRTVEGQQYGVHCRRAVHDGETAPPVSADGAPLDGEEVLLDGNQLAEGHDFFALGAFDVSPDGRWLAYSTDFSGDERFTLRIKDLSTGEVLPDEIPDTFYGTAWSSDASTLFYVTVDDAWRPNRVWRHAVGTPSSEDVVVHQEDDERFWVGVELTRSERFVVIDSHSKITSEVRVIPAANPTGEPAIVAPRRQGVEYAVEHHGHRFLILHNDGAEDFALAYTSADAPGDWTPLIPHTPGTRLEAVDAFENHLVVSLRSNGLTGLRVLPIGGGDAYDIDFPEPLYSVGLDANPEYHTSEVRLRYTSLVTPDSVYDYDLVTRQLVLRRRKPVRPGPDGRAYDPADYEQHRDWALADDGTRVPISLVCRKDTPRDGSAPCVIYGYGSYEASMDPWFSIARLSLLDRGVIFAVAHIRGGGELGRRWYDEGKLLAKKNTFTDFVACARHLVKAGWTASDRLVARGASAGGLLMGAVANLAPDAFAGIVAQVPFVDALTSILDPSLPLTVTEWEEWGNPLDDPEVYAYMKSYTPYENVAAVDYPAILAVTSLNDTRVLYHEPAKWIARLRAVAPQGDYLLKTEMGAGHGGPSGRYDAWREEAFINAWILDRLGRA
ncbi:MULTISPECIES: S9 family peptidase [Micromonospora]|uniref:S9 family peptidase n=1 Tax=Micromonospora solifontis TaxID=2487138 RepID=A0ABX9WFF4_9ACTN|nr:MULTISPECIES: S9 family peptidase [Micromonospora]NES15796.1 S9 family peptidase [Micromonospora sp. PPF5-17B]NES38063.1 S9 family peptidase [Micromonospora solifontis]NES56642.1 S9 family peptidase [Micromonospora sp. PPF5-6]RNL97069.1 S9 family peptidase [Micromonospora solifontis]